MLNKVAARAINRNKLLTTSSFFFFFFSLHRILLISSDGIYHCTTQESAIGVYLGDDMLP